MLEKTEALIGSEHPWLAPSCSLLHVPIDVGAETELDPAHRAPMAFARHEIEELRAYADALAGDAEASARLAEQDAILDRHSNTPGVIDRAVRARAEAVTPAAANRNSDPAARRGAGPPVRPSPAADHDDRFVPADQWTARGACRASRMDDATYDAVLAREIESCVRFQEGAGLDVLVYGEAERNDMVEYFGKQLRGFVFTRHSWVQSYGSRCVKPPVIVGDVARPTPMTVCWSGYAQLLTAKPIKGMLTSPVTMLQWSFVRNDLPRASACRQVALTLRDEVLDLEAAGIGMIQIDEPAFREGLPIRHADWLAYLAWAVERFRITAGGVRDDTQIHTHMCYSGFNDIIEAVAATDADVISIETSRSRMELLGAFARFCYPNGIGPGVYDIHSPRVPPQSEMLYLLRRAMRVLDAGQL